MTFYQTHGQILYFLVNAYTHKPFDAATLHRSYDVEGAGQNFVCKGQMNVFSWVFLVNTSPTT